MGVLQNINAPTHHPTQEWKLKPGFSIFVKSGPVKYTLGQGAPICVNHNREMVLDEIDQIWKCAGNCATSVMIWIAETGV